MFGRYRWLELMYTFSGHFVVLLTLALVASCPAAKLQAALARMTPYAVPCVFAVVLLLCTFVFATICAIPLVCHLLGRHSQAESGYRLTLRLRAVSPLGAARKNFWLISIANCLRDRGEVEQAAKLYESVIACQETNLLAKLTNHGLRDAAAENYAILLTRNGSPTEAAATREKVGVGIIYLRLKYAFTSATIFIFGILFAFWLRLQILSL